MQINMPTMSFAGEMYFEAAGDTSGAWLRLRDRGDSSGSLALFQKGNLSIEEARIRAAALNAVLRGPTDAELAPTQPVIQQAAE